MIELFPEEKVIGVFRGFQEGGLEFHADLVLPYRNEFQDIPMHGQFLLVQLETKDEAVLGRISSLSSDGKLSIGAGEEFNLRAMRERREVPEDLREQYLKYRVNIRVLGVVRAVDSKLTFVASHRRLPHVGSPVAMPSDAVIREIAGHNVEGAGLGFFARRQQRKHQRLERSAGFDGVKLLSQFDFAAVPCLDRSLALEMATCRFIQKKHNWILCGPTGVGKSHLATAIGYEAVKRGMTVSFQTASAMLADLLTGRADGGYAKKMAGIMRCDLLIIDDFGLRQLTETGADDLYEIIHARYERGSIIITSNRSPSEWPELFGNPLMASAALDRLTHHARITIITGESYRQKHRRKPSVTNPNVTNRGYRLEHGADAPNEGGAPNAAAEDL